MEQSLPPTAWPPEYTEEWYNANLRGKIPARLWQIAKDSPRLDCLSTGPSMSESVDNILRGLMETLCKDLASEVAPGKSPRWGDVSMKLLKTNSLIHMAYLLQLAKDRGYTSVL